MDKGVDYIGVTICFFCHDSNGNFVMSKRSNNCRDEHGKWDVGGGALEHGETIEECLIKEVTEEYCTNPLKIDFVGARDVHREHNGKKTHWIALDHKVLVDRDAVRIGEPHKFDDLQWFTKESMPPTEELHPGLIQAIEIYEDKLFDTH